MTVALHMLKLIRGSRNLTPQILSDVTGIPVLRIRALENASTRDEPWLDEAWKLARAVGTAGILQLVSTSGDLTDLDLDFPMVSDMDVWRSGARLPLTLACRLAIQFGVNDPYHLVVEEGHRQIWDIVSTNERGAEPGCCPWCLADMFPSEDTPTPRHAPWCLPDNLWGRRDLIDKAELGHMPRTRTAGAKRTSTAKGWGLKALRCRLMKTQKQFAEAIGMDPTYYPRVERCEQALALKYAERVAAAFRVDVASLYVKPEDQA